MNQAQQPEPIGNVFCRGCISIGTGCKRCGRCAIHLAARVQELEAREPAYTWTGTEADDAMILLGRMDDSLDRERIDQLEKIVPRLAARIAASDRERDAAKSALSGLSRRKDEWKWRALEAESKIAKLLADDERDHSDEDAAIAAGKVQAAVQGRVG